MKITEPGIYEMTAEAYHADPCLAPSLSSHAIVTLLSRSPLHAWSDNSRLNPNYVEEREEDGGDDKKFDVGTAAHRLILEGVDDIFVIDADSWRTKAAKEAADEAREQGYTPLLAKHAKAVRQMAPMAHKAIAECPELAGLTRDDFDPEKTLIWQEDGVWCRARPDLLHREYRIMLDLKSTAASAAPAESTRRVLDGMAAHVQAAWYRRGLLALTGIDAPFIFLNQESKRPYACSFVQATPGYLAIGESKIEVALNIWRECLKTGVWPGYSLSVYRPELKPWVERDWLARLSEETGEVSL